MSNMYMHLIIFVSVIILGTINLMPKEKSLSKKEREEILKNMQSSQKSLNEHTIPLEIYESIIKTLAQKESTKERKVRPSSSVYEDQEVSAPMVAATNPSPAEEAAVSVIESVPPLTASLTIEPWEEEYDKLVQSNIIQFPARVASSEEEEE